MSKVLQVSGLEKIYGKNKNALTKALAGVSFEVEKGEFISIMGPSGSGKSTMINCVATLDKPTSGTVVIGGTAVSTMSNSQLSKFRSEQLGFIFQNSNLLDSLSCFENIALPLSIKGVKATEINERVTKIASQLGIESVLKSYPYEISGGQAQRVAACRALVCQPTLVVADEPTGALDSKNSKILLESFEKMNTQEQATILMVTHDVYAASWSQRVLFLRDGRLYTELVRGNDSRVEFFEKIMDVVSVIGGGADDVL